MNLHSLHTPLNELASVTAASKDAAFLVPSLPTGVHRIITAGYCVTVSLLHYSIITADYWHSALQAK